MVKSNEFVESKPLSSILTPKRVSTGEVRPSSSISNRTDMSRQFAIDRVKKILFMNSSVENQISTLYFELKNSKLKIKNMKRSIFLKKRKIKDEQIELKNLILMLKKEIGRMNKTIGNSRSKFSSKWGTYPSIFR